MALVEYMIQMSEILDTASVKVSAFESWWLTFEAQFEVFAGYKTVQPFKQKMG